MIYTIFPYDCHTGVCNILFVRGTLSTFVHDLLVNVAHTIHPNISELHINKDNNHNKKLLHDNVP